MSSKDYKKIAIYPNRKIFRRSSSGEMQNLLSEKKNLTLTAL